MRGSSAGRALPRRALLLPMVGGLAMAGSGCSLIFTRGPGLDRQPPEPCTPSNGYAVADTAVAVVSVAAVVVGSIAVAEGSKPKSNDLGEAVTGLGLIGAGVIGTAIFVPSAVVGYNRAAACRAWLEIPSPIVPSTPLPPPSGAGPRRESLGVRLFSSAPSPASPVATSSTRW